MESVFALFDVVKLVKERNIQLVHSSGLRPDILNILLWNQMLKMYNTAMRSQRYT